MLDRKVKVGIVGFGYIGRFHSQKADQLENSSLDYIVEPDSKKHEVISKEFPKVNVVTDPKEIIGKVDAVAITTPTSFHFELIKLFMKANIHILCEKPIVESSKQIQELKSLYSEYSGHFQAGHSERCHRCWESLLGKDSPWRDWQKASFRRLAPFKNRAVDVDVISDLMIHDIDLMLWSSGQRPVSVSAKGLSTVTDTWDHVTAHFMFEDGRECLIESARGWPVEIREANLMTTRGNCVVDLKERKYSIATHQKFDSQVKEHSYDAADHLQIEHQKFYDSILNKTESFVDFSSGANAVQLVSAVLESVKTGKSVEVSWSH